MDKFFCARCGTDRMAEPHWFFAPRCEECDFPLDYGPPSYEVDFKEMPDTSFDEEDDEADEDADADNDADPDAEGEAESEGE